MSLASENGILDLPPTLTLENIEALCLKFQGASGTMHLDASQTQTIATPGIQLLLVLSRTLTQQGGKLVLSGAQESFKQAFSTLGLAGQLAQWETDRASV